MVEVCPPLFLATQYPTCVYLTLRLGTLKKGTQTGPSSLPWQTLQLASISGNKAMEPKTEPIRWDHVRLYQLNSWKYRYKLTVPLLHALLRGVYYGQMGV